MTIVCGTDFSEEGSTALRIAVELAARTNTPLHLVHALGFDNSDIVDGDTRAVVARNHRRRLETQAEQLKRPGMQIYFHVGEGAPDELLILIATELSASLVIVGALGQRKRAKWQLGSHADRLAQRSHVPVLIVRDEHALIAWSRGERPLRVLLGADLTASTEVAMQWVRQLAGFGRCEVIGAHLYWPPEQLKRLGLSGVHDYIDPVPVVTETLERDLRQHLTRAGHPVVKLRIEPHLGRIGDRLASIAKEERADLIVVGSHDRGAARIWEGSVSRTVIQQAETSVACVPAPAQPAYGDVPRVRSVLVATDFSPTGNAAVPLAYGAAEKGAVVHLVHVVPDPNAASLAPHDIFPAGRSHRDKYRDLCEQLASLVPKGAAAREQRTELHVLESPHAAEAICQAAERLAVDLICIGTHGRTGLARAIMGSVTEGVLSHTQRALLLARKPAL